MATPTPTTDMIARLRRMTAEPITSDTYTQGDLQEAIARYPVLDANGTEPDDYGWLGAWDINQAAADVWEEKASLVAVDFDFAADGGDYKRSQVQAQIQTLLTSAENAAMQYDAGYSVQVGTVTYVNDPYDWDADDVTAEGVA